MLAKPENFSNKNIQTAYFFFNLIPLTLLLFPQQIFFYTHILPFVFIITFTLFITNLIIFRPKTNFPIYLYSFAWILFLGSVLLSSNNTLSKASTILAFLEFYFIFLLSLNTWILATSLSVVPLISKYLWFIISAIVVTTLYGFINLSFDLITGLNLIYPTYGHHNIGIFALILLPQVLGTLLSSSKPNLTRFLLLIFILVVIILSFSRTALIITLANIFCCYLLFRSKQQSKLLLALALSLVSWIIVLTIFGLYFSNSLSQTQISNHVLLRQIIKPIIHEPRLDYWSQALKGFVGKPFFGHGAGTFDLISTLNKSNSHTANEPHSFFLQILAEQGVVGFVLYLHIIAIALYFYKRHFSSEKPLSHFLFLLGASNLLLASTVEITFNLTYLHTLFWSVIIIATTTPYTTTPNTLKFTFSHLGFIIFLLFPLLTANFVFAFPQSYQHYKLLNKSNFLKYILLDGQSLFDSDQSTYQFVSYWHQFDPQINLTLAQNTNLSLNQKQNLLHNALRVDNTNPEITRELIKIHLQQSNFYQAHHLLLTQIQNTALTFIPTPPPTTITNSLLSLLLNPEIDYQLFISTYLYNLGLSEFHNHLMSNAESLFIHSVQLSPHWSYFYIELANYYFSQNQPDKAQQTLNNCLQSPFAQLHCTQYQQLINQYRPQSIGSQQININQSIGLK